MADIRVVGEGGAEFTLDDTVPYVVEQLASGQLRPVDPEPASPDGPAKRTRARKTAPDD